MTTVEKEVRPADEEAPTGEGERELALREGWLAVPQVVEESGLSHMTVCRALDRRQLPSVSFTNHVRLVSREAFEEWMARRSSPEVTREDDGA